MKLKRLLLSFTGKEYLRIYYQNDTDRILLLAGRFRHVLDSLFILDDFIVKSMIINNNTISLIIQSD